MARASKCTGTDGTAQKAKKEVKFEKKSSRKEERSADLKIQFEVKKLTSLAIKGNTEEKEEGITYM